MERDDTGDADFSDEVAIAEPIKPIRPRTAMINDTQMAIIEPRNENRKRFNIVMYSLCHKVKINQRAMQAKEHKWLKFLKKMLILVYD